MNVIRYHDRLARTQTSPAETQPKLDARLRRRKVTANGHDAKAILPEPRSVKKANQFMKSRIKSLLLAMGLICLSVEALAQDLPPLPPDTPLPADYDPVLAQQQWELLQQQYWQRQQEIFERDFLPWLVQDITLPNGQPYTLENEEAYQREQLLALAAELSLSQESDPEYGWQQRSCWENFEGVENGMPAYYTTYVLPDFGGSFGGIVTSDPGFSFGEPLAISTVPEPGVLSLITIGLAAFLLCHARKGSNLGDKSGLTVSWICSPQGVGMSRGASRLKTCDTAD